MKAAIDAQVQAIVTLELEKQKDKQTIELTRKLRIDQKKAAFKNASDKRAIGFLYDVKFDMEDFLANFKKVIDEDDNVVDVMDYVENLKKFLDFCTGFGNMFNQKIKKDRGMHTFFETFPLAIFRLFKFFFNTLTLHQYFPPSY